MAITKYSLIAMTRNRSTFFFGFLFPLVFIGIFGLIGNTTSKIIVGIPTDSNQTFINQIISKQSSVTVDKDTKAVLENKLKQGKIAAIVLTVQTKSFPPKYKVTLQTSSAQPQAAATAVSFIQGIVDQSDLRLAGVTNPPITLIRSEISGRDYRYIDYALPGMIGFSLLGTALFGTVFGFIFLKKQLVIKRMFATPMRKLTFLFGQGTSRLLIALVQTALILAVGVFVFHFYLPSGWQTFLELLLISAFGLLAFLGFGYFASGLVNDENSAGPLINLITLPQFLLSGTFFPVDNLPKWVQPIANNLPLSYFNEAVRKLTTESGTLHDALTYLGGLAVWGVVMYLLATLTFKWE